MGTLNPTLREILDTADEYHDGNVRDAAQAVMYAVLVRIEQDLGIPVFVKYGQADALVSGRRIDGDSVWEATPTGDDYVLFRVEPRDSLSTEEWRQIEKTMHAIGAWYVGIAGVKHDPNWEHHHYVWRTDHPVVEMVSEPE